MTKTSRAVENGTVEGTDLQRFKLEQTQGFWYKCKNTLFDMAIYDTWNFMQYN